jgi:uncharacterized protein (DUF1697 family)
MALIVLLRGINVGGHRAFRPKRLAQELSAYDVVNIGATGTFVVRKPDSRAHFRAALRSRLPATTQFVFCEGRDLLRLDATDPFDKPPPCATAHHDQAACRSLNPTVDLRIARASHALHLTARRSTRVRLIL